MTSTPSTYSEDLQCFELELNHWWLSIWIKETIELHSEFVSYKFTNSIDMYDSVPVLFTSSPQQTRERTVAQKRLTSGDIPLPCDGPSDWKVGLLDLLISAPPLTSPATHDQVTTHCSSNCALNERLITELQALPPKITFSLAYNLDAV